MKNRFALVTVWVSLTTFITTSTPAWAWGRLGHQTVGVVATYLVSSTEEGAADLRGHSFDIGYYCNVPDFQWKRPATYDTEKPQHFMDLEIFERAFKNHPEIKNPFALSRKDFDAAFPEVQQSAGRSFWRIRELNDQMDKAGETLRAQTEQKGKDYQALMEKWLIPAGILCHYVGDLSMPLHVSENYDGNLSGQKGIHHYFEDTCVDEMFPKLTEKVYSAARAQWKGFVAKNKTKSPLELIDTLAEGSKAEIAKMLAIDKSSHREQVAKTCAKYDKMISERITQSALVLAELYRRSLGWKFDDDKFFFFPGEIPFIPPGEPASASLPALPAK